MGSNRKDNARKKVRISVGKTLDKQEILLNQREQK